MESRAVSSALRKARRERGWTQQRAAARLGVTQAYVSMLENGSRDAGPLLHELVAVYDLPPEALPLKDPATDSNLDFAVELAGFGYPGFAHLVKHRPKMNPAVFLLAALGSDNLEARAAEALPWLVVKHPAMNYEWLVREACARTLQNRLGFVFSLAQAVAPNDALRPWLEKLAACKLVREDGFCRRLNPVERRWLQDNTSPEAKQWNLLSSLRPNDVRYTH
jgi:transcriptional regulator with XRE-family HTH domain